VGKSLETTRRFDALKVLVTLRALGRERVGQLLDLTIASARTAAALVRRSEDLELLAAPMTNTVILRWTGPGPRVNRERADAVNRHLPYRLWRAGGPVVGTALYRSVCAVKLTFVSPLHDDAQIEHMLARLSAAASALGREFEREGAKP
jgi:L-2,4-diaminobutyrate decarboxylase